MPWSRRPYQSTWASFTGSLRVTYECFLSVNSFPSCPFVWLWGGIISLFPQMIVRMLFVGHYGSSRPRKTESSIGRSLHGPVWCCFPSKTSILTCVEGGRPQHCQDPTRNSSVFVFFIARLSGWYELWQTTGNKRSRIIEVFFRFLQKFILKRSLRILPYLEEDCAIKIWDRYIFHSDLAECFVFYRWFGLSILVRIQLRDWLSPLPLNIKSPGTFSPNIQSQNFSKLEDIVFEPAKWWYLVRL